MNDNFKNIISQNLKLRKENENLKKENKELKTELKKTQTALSFANRKIKLLEDKIQNMEENYSVIIEKAVKEAITKTTNELNIKHEEEIKKLNATINRLEKMLNIDSTNSGVCTSKNKIGKKIIQNNREKSDKSIGSQKGHKIHKLDYFKDEEITNKVDHKLDICPECGGKLIEENIVKSDIIDVDIKVTKTRNNIHNYKCSHCKKKISANNTLPRGVSYGDNINAIALSMMNEENTALNKISTFISGITDNKINLSDGYLVKLQKKSAKNLDKFTYELSETVKKLKNLFWDDTVVSFGTGKPEEDYDDKDLEYMEDEKNKNKKVRSGIIRFYGNDNLALLIGHRYKGQDSIDDDGILDNLSNDCVVMHDHVLLNYNYPFKNAECNEHTRRYLKGVMDMFPNHKWASQMRNFLSEVNENKKELIKKNISSFDEEKINSISKRYDEIISLGYEENSTVDLTYILNKNDELNLIERLEKFKENHLMFATDFSVAFTNNCSERGLRQVKRKLAVAFMFKNANRMKDYAKVLSYLETAFRNGITRYEAAKRLVSGNPYTVAEMLKEESIKSSSL